MGGVPLAWGRAVGERICPGRGASGSWVQQPRPGARGQFGSVRGVLANLLPDDKCPAGQRSGRRPTHGRPAANRRRSRVFRPLLRRAPEQIGDESFCGSVRTIGWRRLPPLLIRLGGLAAASANRSQVSTEPSAGLVGGWSSRGPSSGRLLLRLGHPDPGRRGRHRSDWSCLEKNDRLDAVVRL